MARLLQSSGYDISQCKCVLSKDGQELGEDVLQRYRCIFCTLILKGACQMKCGDRVCKECFPIDKTFHCPACDEFIDPGEPQQYFNDRSCQNDLKRLVVRCVCEWKGSLQDWEQHLNTCTEISPPDNTSNTVSSRDEITQIWKAVNQIKADCLKKIEALASRDVELHSRVQKLTDKCTTLSDIVTQLVADMEQQKGTVSQVHATLDHVSQTIPRYESMLEELNLKIEILEVKSTSGVYVWKVNDLARRSREARTGRTVSLYSPPLYTSIHGYRLCLRVYLFGDGVGKGTHISLFIVLMKSEYDDLLLWPFLHRVTLSIINQDHPLDPESAITHKFIPNPTSNSFQKPTETFNVASGFPEFAPLDALNDSTFVKNDTVYFRVMLEAPERPTGPDQIDFQ